MIQYKLIDSYKDNEKGEMYVLEVVNQMYKRVIEIEKKVAYRYLIINKH